MTRLAASRAAIIAAAVGVCAPLPAQQKVPLVLHHLTIVLDSATWRDVATSPFLRTQFSGRDSSVQESCRSLFGKYNFVTLCRPGRRVQPRARAGEPGPLAVVGDIEVTLSSEVPGGLDRLARTGPFQRFEESAGPARWYAALLVTGADSTSDRARLAFMQYTPETAKELAKTDSLSVTNFANSRFMTQDYNPAKLLERTSGATLAIPADDITRIVTVLGRAGVTVVAEGQGATIMLDGFTLKLIPPWTGAGVKQLQFALTRAAVANPTYRFGPKSQLRFGPGPIAVWDFENK